MKKIIILLIIGFSLLSCKAQSEIDDLKQKLSEVEQRMIEIYNENVLLRDSVVYYKELANTWKLQYETIDPYNDSIYNINVDYTDVFGSEYNFKHKDGNAVLSIVKNNKKMYFKQTDTEFQLWFSQWIDTTYVETIINNFDLNWLK